jgi:hypothetical protein
MTVLSILYSGFAFFSAGYKQEFPESPSQKARNFQNNSLKDDAVISKTGYKHETTNKRERSQISIIFP